MTLQTLSPSDAQAWSDIVERGGIIGVLVLVITLLSVALSRKWLVPGYVVADKDLLIAELKAERKQYLHLLLRVTDVADNAVGVIQQQRG